MSASQIKISSQPNLTDSTTANTTRKDASPEVAVGGKIPRGPKPIVLSSQRYEKILNNASNNDSKIQQKLEEEKKHLEQLKAGNDELVAQFKGNMQRTHEQKMQQIKDELDRKTQKARESYEQTKENEAQKRREKIAKAQQLVEKLKPGPRELHTAVLQSEVLRARNVQHDINQEYKKAIKKQECVTKVMCEGQAMSWIHEEQQRLADRQKNENLYKRELLQTINENQRQRSEQRKQMIKEQQAAREATDSDIKAQIEKEKAVMEKKRATLRKNALEAMKMVEQRRMRDNFCNQVEDRLCCVYNNGKRQMDALISEQTKQLATSQQNKIEEEVKKLSAIEDNSQAIEAERIRRDITTMQLKFTAEEQEKVRKDKAAKQARIEAHLREMEVQKEAQRRANEEKRFEMVQRFKNAEVNCSFVERERQERITNAQNVRSFLDQQVQENNRNKLAQKLANTTCKDDTEEKEHKFFFEYARELMDDAQQKSRPLYPFVKAVQQYKRENQIDLERKVPRHMKTHISIGRQTSTSAAAAAQKNNRQEELPPNKIGNAEKDTKDTTNTTRDSILKNCLKIDEIILKSKKDEKQQLDNPTIDCGAGGAGKTLNPNDECASVTSSVKLRYSMHDLKKLNQFAAPSCH